MPKLGLDIVCVCACIVVVIIVVVFWVSFIVNCFKITQ